MTKPDRVRMTAVILLTSLVILAVHGCASTREPLIGLDFWRGPQPAAEGDALSCAMTGVDDIGDVWIINQVTFATKYFSPALRAEWQGADGQAEGDLTRYLDRGVNYVVFTLFNRKFKGVSIHESGGKFRCDFRLYLDRQQIYAKKLYKQYNDQRLVFAAVFKVVVGKDRKLAISALEPEEKVRMTEVVRTGIARVLHDTADEVDVDWRAIAYRALMSDPEVRRALEELRKMQEDPGM